VKMEEKVELWSSINGFERRRDMKLVREGGVVEQYEWL